METGPCCAIYVIHSYELGWDAVRAALRRWAPEDSYRSFATRKDIVEALPSIAPSIVLASNMIEGESSLPILAMLRQRLGEPLLISMFVNEMDSISIREFAQLNLNGFFQWGDLRTTKAVSAALHAALTPELLSATSAIAYSYMGHAKTYSDAALEVEVTHRQRQVLRLLVEGHTYDAMALELKCSPRTIARDLERLASALHADNTFELIVRSTLAGLLPSIDLPH